MLLADVNVLIYAHRLESPRSMETRAWLTGALAGDEPFGGSEFVLSGFLRIVTNHRVYREPTPPDRALEFCETVLAAPPRFRFGPAPGTGRSSPRCAAGSGARANLVPDAFLAALAIEHGATWVTTDRGFAWFPGLRWQALLDW